MDAILLGELRDLVLLACERAHYTNTGEVLLQHAGHRSFGLVGDLEHLLHLVEEDVREQPDERDQAQRHPREPRVEPEQNRRYGEDQQDRAADLHHVAREEYAQRFDVGTAALYEVAGVGVIVVTGAQVVQVAIQRFAQAPHDRFGGNRRPNAAHVLEHTANTGHRNGKYGGQQQVPGERVLRAECLLQPLRRSHQHRRTERDVLRHHHVDRILRDQRRAEHAEVCDRHCDDGTGVADALPGGDGPEIVVFRVCHDPS